jgi:ketosteroid isomerase-like protein
MKSILTFLTIIFTVQLSFSQTAFPGRASFEAGRMNAHMAFFQSKDIAELKRLNEAWIGAYPKKDSATLGNILAPDFTVINAFGKKLTRSDVLNNTIRNESGMTSAKVDSVDVRIIGIVGLLTAKASFTFMDQGKEVLSQTSYLDVYEKRNGKWVAIAAHVTLLK